MSELFFATLLMEASSDHSDSKPLYEENFSLIRAEGEEDAVKKAHQYGCSSEHSYKNIEGHTITWHFREVISVTPLVDDDLNKNVVELHGRYLRDIDSFNKLRTIDD